MGNGNHLKFLLAGIFFVFAINYFLEKRGGAPILHDAYYVVPDVSSAISAEEKREAGAVRQEPAIQTLDAVPETEKPKMAYGPVDLPAWRKYAVPVVLDPHKPKIAIVIDDLGMSAAHTKETLALPGPLTLAFLPYAQGLDGYVRTGRRQGHDIMVHMPMEPMDMTLDMGSVFLSESQTPEEFSAMLDKGLSAFGGYVGINNHMGSRLTQDREAMNRVMAVLADRGLLFLDSRTVAASVAVESAQQYRVPFAVRDVFLDDDPSLENVEMSLAKTEKIAREKGLAIAIGHPKQATLAALETWLPTLAAKGFQLIPISAAVKAPQGSLPETTAHARENRSGNVKRLQ